MLRNLLISSAVLILSWTPLTAQWSGKIIKSKYDGNFGYAQVKLKPLDSKKNIFLRAEIDLDQSPPNLSLMLTDGYFCGDGMTIRFQIDMGDEIKEFLVTGYPFDGRDNLALGEYTTMNHEGLFEALMRGREGRITVYNDPCSVEKYHLSLSGSSKAIQRLLTPYKQGQKEAATLTEKESQISKGDSVEVETMVGLYKLDGDEFRRVKENYNPYGVYTGNYIRMWGEFYFEIDFKGKKYYVISIVVKPIEDE